MKNVTIFLFLILTFTASLKWIYHYKPFEVNIEILITSEPPNRPVEIDGEYMGYTPITVNCSSILPTYWEIRVLPLIVGEMSQTKKDILITNNTPKQLYFNMYAIERYTQGN